MTGVGPETRSFVGPPSVPQPQRRRLPGLPWPLFAVLVIQVLLSMRLIWSNTAYIDEATYLFVGTQDLNHWIHGVPIEDYQTFLSGSPAVYPPLAALVNAVGGLTAARFLSLAFMGGASCLLYVTTARLFDKWTALLATALFAGLAGTQFLGALATYDAMSLFLLALSAYLVVGRNNSYDTLTDVACSSVIAAALLALANAGKYASALWDPFVIALACCRRHWTATHGGTGSAGRCGSPSPSGRSLGSAWSSARPSTSRASRTRRSPGRPGRSGWRSQPAWSCMTPGAWIALVLVCRDPRHGAPPAPGRPRFPGARRGAVAVLCLILVFAAVAAPLNQARIGTSVSLQKHVIFGAWFGCVLAGYAVTWLLRARELISVVACALLVPLGGVNAMTAQGLYNWPTENPAFISALKGYVRPGNEEYLISGFSDIPAYYIKDVSSLQWKEVGSFSYTNPQTGVTLDNGAAYIAAIQRRALNLIILDFQGNGVPGEPVRTT